MANQLSLFNESTSKNKRVNTIVNVASVPHRSPFRYPGGKTWLVPRVRQWIASLPKQPVEFIEPFAGGGIISLTVAFEKLAEQVTLVELDEDVAAVWRVIIEEGNGQRLAHQIETFELTQENVEAVINAQPDDLSTWAFQTVVRNRVSRGGILAKGAGLIKNGENGKGLRSRWYPKTLAQRIKGIDYIRNRLTFVQGDGLTVVEKNAHRDDVVFFIDPPYTAGRGKRAGRRLYNYSELEHPRLYELMQSVQGDFLMTYDNDEDVRNLAASHGFDLEPIAMKSTHHAEMTELLIGKNLGWLRD